MNLSITNGFERLSDAALVIRANEIITAMTDNAHFPTPEPALSTVSNGVTTFQTALMAALTGNRYNIDLKNQKHRQLIDLLHLLGNYVVFTARLDAVAVASSGLRIAKEPSPAPEISKPENLQLSDGINPGELTISFKRVPGARSYLYQYTREPVTPQSVWATENGTLRRTVLKNLERRTAYRVRIAALGTGNQMVHSDVVSRVVGTIKKC